MNLEYLSVFVIWRITEILLYISIRNCFFNVPMNNTFRFHHGTASTYITLLKISVKTTSIAHITYIVHITINISLFPDYTFNYLKMFKNMYYKMRFVLPADPDWPDLFQERYSCSIDKYEREITRNKSQPRKRYYASLNQQEQKKEKTIMKVKNVKISNCDYSMLMLIRVPSIIQLC